jgi:tetratricopeptide (TPR) repeat protein
MKQRAAGFPAFLFPVILAVFPLVFDCCASFGLASAEEYYNLGMAYYELGKFEESEKWFTRAKIKDKTKTASEYQLGRIAYETGRYGEASALFEGILKKDPLNLPALKAAAYSRIKTGEFEKAEKLYQRVLDLSPESADDGYNYALVLFAVKKYAEAENVLAANGFALRDNKDVLLLYARVQKIQDKPEAADSYDKYFAAGNEDPRARYEYAQVLEKLEFYARALEQYREALKILPAESEDPKKGDLRFIIARLLLVADSENPEGLSELSGAVSDGFTGKEALAELLKDERISAAGKTGIQELIDEMERSAREPSELSDTSVDAAADAAGLETDIEGSADSPDE